MLPLSAITFIFQHPWFELNMYKLTSTSTLFDAAESKVIYFMG